MIKWKSVEWVKSDYIGSSVDDEHIATYFVWGVKDGVEYEGTGRYEDNKLVSVIDIEIV
jgi:hypothetical protein